MTLPKARLVTDALLTVLSSAPVLIGDGETPAGGGYPGGNPLKAFVPYANLHPLAGGVTGGSLERPDDDARIIYQVTSVGSTREQAEWVSDETQDVLLSLPVSVDGRDVLLVTVDMLGGARRDDSLGASSPPVWVCPSRYRVTTTPTTD